VRADCADPFSRRALRAAAGASLTPSLNAPISDLTEVPHPKFAAVTTGGIPPEEVPSDAAIVLGNERTGLSAAELAACEAKVTIEAPGFESLNVAAAAAILLYSRTRGAPEVE
jgi:tRNA G18 (ribose-2'-O)-methylase SpoU